ncbi:MAG: flavin reductase [Clostridia bacterium]|nr:flavin reductase [Clostridia bacterium]
MNNFKEITPYEIENAMKLIGKDWMLITAAKENNINTMTASWGDMGVLWGKNVCTVYIRPQRYTFEFVESSDRLSLSFFDEKYRGALKYCGTKSGRDCDKLADTGLTSTMIDGVPIINEAKLVLVCRKLYADDLKKDKFLVDEPLSNYKNDDFHRFYICEIEKVLTRIEN